MKKLILIISICLFTISGFARNFYVSSDNEKLYCKSIHLGKEFTKAVLENGNKVIVPTAEIKMYSLNGKIFEKLPVYTNNKNAQKNVFMQFVATRAGLKLYKYSSVEETMDSKTGAYLGVQKVDRYCVYKGDQFWVNVTDKNYTTLLDFFRVSYK